MTKKLAHDLNSVLQRKKFIIFKERKVATVLKIK